LDTPRASTLTSADNPCDKHLRAGRICVRLPHNDDVAKPRALNTFLEGLAELGVDKRLIKNKKLLSDLVEKEKEYRNNEGSENNEEQSTDSEDEVETASENS